MMHMNTLCLDVKVRWEQVNSGKMREADLGRDLSCEARTLLRVKSKSRALLTGANWGTLGWQEGYGLPKSLRDTDLDFQQWVIFSCIWEPHVLFCFWQVRGKFTDTSAESYFYRQERRVSHYVRIREQKTSCHHSQRSLSPVMFPSGRGWMELPVTEASLCYAAF